MLLQAENLHRQFGNAHVLKGVHLHIAARELHAIIGPNGAGKTTLVAQLCGEIKTRRGRIRFAGEDITHLAQHRRAALGLARSFQITNVIAPMTLLENVMLAAQAVSGPAVGFWSPHRFWHPFSADANLRARAMRALATVGLESRAEMVAATVSHGEQRQLELAMALVAEPKLVLLDEPMAGVSREESADMLALLRALKGRLTIVLVEHDMDAVFAVADTVSVLVDGRIIATGAAAAIRGNREVRRAYLGDAC